MLAAHRKDVCAALPSPKYHVSIISDTDQQFFSVGLGIEIQVPILNYMTISISDYTTYCYLDYFLIKRRIVRPSVCFPLILIGTIFTTAIQMLNQNNNPKKLLGYN